MTSPDKPAAVKPAAEKPAAVKGPASYFPAIEKAYGRPIAEWKALIRSRPEGKHMELVAWLKAAHGLGHGHANALVAHTRAEDGQGGVQGGGKGGGA